MELPPSLRSDLSTHYAFTVSEYQSTAKLDQNEAPIDVPEPLKDELLSVFRDRLWNRYVQPRDYVDAKNQLASALGLSPQTIAITSGADQGLVVSAIIGGGGGRVVRWFEPTYPYVGHAARRSSARCEPVILSTPGFVPTADMVTGSDLVFLVSPNNPTGAMVDREVVLAALSDRRRLVAVDEAYFDFSEETVADLIAEHDNLIVIRSLSKSMLAAVHLGYVISNPATIRAVENVLSAPYHLTAFQLVVAGRYRRFREIVASELVPMIREERERVTRALEEIPSVTKVYPSRASFVLFATNRYDHMVAALADSRVRVRDVTRLPNLADHLRVTIGTPEQNSAFLRALGALEQA